MKQAVLELERGCIGGHAMLPRRERNHQPWRDAGASLRTALALETLVHLVAGIDANRQHADLSSGEARTRSRQKYKMQEHYWIDM